MTYKINGEEFVIQPTLGQWVPRQELGISGAGHAIYPSVREFELQWNVNSPSGTYQLQSWFDQVLATGTAIIDLPKFADAEYTFISYTGCYLREPQWGPFFSEHITNVTMRITGIRT